MYCNSRCPQADEALLKLHALDERMNTLALRQSNWMSLFMRSSRQPIRCSCFVCWICMGFWNALLKAICLFVCVFVCVCLFVCLFVFTIDYILITNLMHWLLFIHKILFTSTCFEPQVLIFRRIQLYTCSIWYCHLLWEFLVACRYTAWVRTDWRRKVDRAS